MCHFVYSSFSFTGVISKVGSVQCKCTVLIAMAVTKDGPLYVHTYVRTHIHNPTSEASHVCALRTYMWMQQSIQALLVYNLYVCMYVYLHNYIHEYMYVFHDNGQRYSAYVCMYVPIIC